MIDNNNIGRFGLQPLVTGKADKKRREEKSGRSIFGPGRARRNVIPTPEEMQALIERALQAMGKGVYWDRGSILNIVL